MPKFAANLSFLYTDRPLLERIAAAAKAGFKAVEFMFPYEAPPETVKKALDDNGVIQVLFNAPAGDFAGGERGLASLAGRDKDFEESLEAAIKYAKVLQCNRINVMAGIPKNQSFDQSMDQIVERLAHAGDVFAKHNLMVLLEHINNYDFVDYFAATPAIAMEILKRVNRPNVRLQFDVYHAQRSQGELVAFMRENIGSIEHVQIADNPGRHQPNTGEINYAFVLKELDKLGFNGYVGLEYKPDPDADSSYGWIKEMGYTIGF